MLSLPDSSAINDIDPKVKKAGSTQHASKEGQFLSNFRFERAKLATKDPFFPYAMVVRADSHWFLLTPKTDAF